MNPTLCPMGGSGFDSVRWAIFSTATASMHPKRIEICRCRGVALHSNQGCRLRFRTAGLRQRHLHSPDEEKFRIAHQGAVLICAEGGSAGKKCGLTDRDICFGNKLFANELYGQIPSRFILYVYLSPAFRASFTAAMTGIIGGVSIAKFVEIPIPLPPLEEQHRIVAKVDQLMAQCDVLENLRIEREKALDHTRRCDLTASRHNWQLQCRRCLGLYRPTLRRSIFSQRKCHRTA